MVEPGRLRFDFSHYAAMDRAEIEEVERLTNEQILRNVARWIPTFCRWTEKAIATGAMALFGEKIRRPRARGERSRFQPRALRRHARPADRRYRRLQNCLQKEASPPGSGAIEAITGAAALRQYQEDHRRAAARWPT